MPRIEFYVLPGTQPAARLQAACQLTAKAWRADLTVFIRAENPDQCNELDELLWRFRAERFIPHALYQSDPLAPVVIGLEQAPQHDQGVLINLSATPSEHPERFSRIIEIVDQQAERLEICRQHFRHYRQLGYAPQRVEL